MVVPKWAPVCTILALGKVTDPDTPYQVSQSEGFVGSVRGVTGDLLCDRTIGIQC